MDLEQAVIGQEAPSAEAVTGIAVAENEPVSSNVAAGADSATLSAGANSSTEEYSLPEYYNIDISRPLEHLNGGYGRAFEVDDRRNKSDVYALIMPNNVPVRLHIIQKLKDFYNTNFTNIVDAGFTQAGGGRFGNYAVIVEKPSGVTLQEYIAGLMKQASKNEEFVDDSFIATEIINPLNELLKALKEAGIAHGKINPSTVYLDLNKDSGKKLKLAEPISESCGFSQPTQFETLYRAMCLPEGKGEANIKDDYFALGVLLYFLIFGKIPGQAADDDTLVRVRLSKGSYKTYVGDREVIRRMTDLLRGLCNDEDKARWGYEQVRGWVGGKQSNLIVPTIRTEASRAIEFRGKAHNTKSALCYAYSKNWVDAISEVRSGKIKKWLEFSVDKSELSEEIGVLISTSGIVKSKAGMHDDLLLSKALIILDSDAPIRYRNISTKVGGMGQLLCDAWRNQKQSDLQTISEMISSNIADFKLQRLPDNDKNERWILQRLKDYIKTSTFGFGLERCLYDLNAHLPCQSMMMSDQFIVDIKQLLHFLNDNASRLSSEHPVDRHIAAFIASKLDFSQELGARELRKFKSREHKDLILKLLLLTYAQKSAGLSKLSGLAGWVAAKMAPILDLIKSAAIKDELRKDLNHAVKMGSLELILKTIITSDYFKRDEDSFRAAKQKYGTYHNEMIRIHNLKKTAIKHNTYYHYGLYIAKMISVFVFLITLSVFAL